MVYLEAMACNLPVVATDDELRRGIVSGAGEYVAHPKDIADYAAVLQRALAENWEDRPRRQAAQFDWEKISLQYEAEFATLK